MLTYDWRSPLFTSRAGVFSRGRTIRIGLVGRDSVRWGVGQGAARSGCAGGDRQRGGVAVGLFALDEVDQVLVELLASGRIGRSASCLRNLDSAPRRQRIIEVDFEVEQDFGSPIGETVTARAQAEAFGTFEVILLLGKLGSVVFGLLLDTGEGAVGAAVEVNVQEFDQGEPIFAGEDEFVIAGEGDLAADGTFPDGFGEHLAGGFAVGCELVGEVAEGIGEQTSVGRTTGGVAAGAGLEGHEGKSFRVEAEGDRGDEAICGDCSVGRMFCQDPHPKSFYLR